LKKKVIMFKLHRTCLTLALIGATFPALAQTPATASRQITVTLQANTSKGEAVRGLTAADFKLLDNKAAKPISAAKELTPAQEPVSLFLVVDTVNIDYSRLSYVRSEIQKFLATNGGKLAHPTTFVVVTDKGAEIQQGFSTSGDALTQSLNQYPFGLREIRRDTGVWGADERMNISLNALQLLVQHAATLPGRKLVLWISPGWPLLTGPRIQLADREQKQLFHEVVALSTQMRTAKVTLDNINPLGPGENLSTATYYQDFVKGIKKPSDVEIADLSLQVLAVQSGGNVVTSNSDVAGNLTKSVADANSWYEITFDAAHAEKPDEYHHIQIEADKPGTTIRTRDGYYAQP
jgi:VWFA-related protein